VSQIQSISKNNTSVGTVGGMTCVTLFRTVVVRFNQQKVILNSGGWKTITTKARMNQVSNQFGLGFQVWQEDFKWFVRTPGGEVVRFEDGMEMAR